VESGELLGDLGGHLSIWQIYLVPNQELEWIPLWSLALETVKPFRDVLKTLPIPDVINNGNAVGASVVGGRKRAKALLPCGIPDLEFDIFAVNCTCVNFEVNTDGREMNIGEIGFDDSRQERALANACVSDNDDLCELERKQTEKMLAEVRNQIDHSFTEDMQNSQLAVFGG
jgi:hypothetical protein